jgi:hypothetical protein
MFRNDITEMVDEMLDEQGDIEIGSLSYSRSQVLRSVDPIAYRLTVNEMIDSLISDLEYDIECLDADDDAEDIEEIHVRIAELQDSYI